MAQNNVRKDISSVIKNLQSKYGEGSIGFLGSMPKTNVEALSTGVPDLDMALGIGGLPLGRIVEVFGPEGSGKTTTALALVASFQKQERICAFIDVEHALDPARAKQLGVDLDALIFSQPDTAEESLDLVCDLAVTGEISLIIIDSVAALMPQEEEEKDMSQSTIGLQARLLSKACRKLKGILNNNKCTAVFINQIREKVGSYAPNGQVPTTTPGGRALKFFSSIRMDVRKGDIIGTYEKQQGQTVKVKIVKNKVAAPFKEANYDLYNDDRGIDVAKGLITRSAEVGIIDKSGNWFYYPTKENPQELFGVMCKWNGIKTFTADLQNNKELFDMFYNLFIEKVKTEPVEHETEDSRMSDDEIVNAVIEEVGGNQ
jgi:recombination protein RecA